jgi:hypothetical protein
MLAAVSLSIDVVVATNSKDLSLSCLETLLKYASNAAKTDDKYRIIKKSNDIYQAESSHFF